MRELWWGACGKIDLEVANRAFWMTAFGQKVTAEQLDYMHPLRRLEKSPAERAETGEAGWAVLGAALKAINQDRGK